MELRRRSFILIHFERSRIVIIVEFWRRAEWRLRNVPLSVATSARRWKGSGRRQPTTVLSRLKAAELFQVGLQILHLLFEQASLLFLLLLDMVTQLEAPKKDGIVGEVESRAES